MTLYVFRPVPFDDTQLLQFAPRLDTLRGKRVGFIGNLKPNCDVLLHTTEDLLEQLDFSRYTVPAIPSRSPSRSSVVCSRTSQLGLRLPMEPTRLPRNVSSRGANWSSCVSSNGTGRNTYSVMGFSYSALLVGPAVFADVHGELDGLVL